MYKYAFLLMTLAALGCHNGPGPATAASDSTAIPVVQTFHLTARPFSTPLLLPGDLRPYQTVDLYAKVNSFVRKMLVDVGSQVQEGQLLATLEAPELNAQLKEAASAYHSKEAVFAGDRLVYQRLLRTSRIPGTIAPNDLDNAYARMAADSADLMAARSKYDEAQALSGYLEVRAPFSGVISIRNVYAGAYVGPAGKGSDKPMLTLEQQDRLRLTVAVPEADIKGLKINDSVRFTVAPIPGRTFSARVSRMAGSMDPVLRTEAVEMDVDNNGRNLLPGMYAQVQINNTSAGPTFVVPSSAVTSTSASVFVIAVRDSRTTWIPVRKGRVSADSVEVFGSFSGSDSLVVRASDELRNGAVVKSSISFYQTTPSSKTRSTEPRR